MCKNPAWAVSQFCFLSSKLERTNDNQEHFKLSTRFLNITQHFFFFFQLYYLYWPLKIPLHPPFLAFIFSSPFSAFISEKNVHQLQFSSSCQLKLKYRHYFSYPFIVRQVTLAFKTLRCCHQFLVSAFMQIKRPVSSASSWLPLVSKVLSSSYGCSRMDIIYPLRQSAVLIRDVASKFKDCSFEGLFRISPLSLPSSFFHHPLDEHFLLYPCHSLCVL